MIQFLHSLANISTFATAFSNYRYNTVSCLANGREMIFEIK
jgi:hypothetical protein